MALTSMALRQVRADKRVAILDGDNAIDYRLNCERGACALRFEFLAQKIFFALRFELAQKIFFAVNIHVMYVHNNIVYVRMRMWLVPMSRFCVKALRAPAAGSLDRGSESDHGCAMLMK